MVLVEQDVDRFEHTGQIEVFESVFLRDGYERTGDPARLTASPEVPDGAMGWLNGVAGSG